MVRLINPKSHSDCHKILFKHDFDLSENDIFNTHLNASRNYIKDLLSRLDQIEYSSLYAQLSRIYFDFLPLLKQLRNRYPTAGIKIYGGERAMHIKARTAKDTAFNIFHGRLNANNKYPYFIHVYSIFSIRQAIELAGKEIIGLDSILKENGQPSYRSMLPWEFLKKYTSNDFIKMPFRPSDVLLVYKWANSFTHSGKDSVCYIVFTALQIVDSIFQGQIKKTISFEGTQENIWDWDIVIYNYNQLKSTFEQFLTTKTVHNTQEKGGNKKSLTAVWNDREKLATVTG
jgi:hypothetical protein